MIRANGKLLSAAIGLKEGAMCSALPLFGITLTIRTIAFFPIKAEECDAILFLLEFEQFNLIEDSQSDGLCLSFARIHTNRTVLDALRFMSKPYVTLHLSNLSCFALSFPSSLTAM